MIAHQVHPRRRRSLLALGRINTPAARQRLIQSLDDPNPCVAIATAAGLASQ